MSEAGDEAAVSLYRLTRELAAVQVTGVPQGPIFTHLPEGAIVRLTGDGVAPGLVQVLCSGLMYNVFLEDLDDRGTRVLATAG